MTIVKEVEPKFYGKKKIKMVECICDCGNSFVSRLQNIKSQHTKSCGCLQKSKSAENCLSRTKHNHSTREGHTATYISYRGMIERTTNPKHKSYQYYGGRGIKVCDRWKNSYLDFLNDMGERPQGLTIDRIDSNGNYEPLNCRWSDTKTQLSNRR
jgi:hypothetical protein